MANASFETARPIRLFGLAAPIQRFADALRQRAEDRKAYNRTLAELQSMSDRELNDFGFHRSELPRIAREAVGIR